VLQDGGDQRIDDRQMQGNRQETVMTSANMFNSPMDLGGGLWKSMGEGVKDLGSSAQNLNPVSGLKNLGDSALKFDPGHALKHMGDTAINFNPVDSMKQLGKSASNLGESAMKLNPAKNSMEFLPKNNLFGSVTQQDADAIPSPKLAGAGTASREALTPCKSSTGEVFLASPWRDRKDVRRISFIVASDLLDSSLCSFCKVSTASHDCLWRFS
jgi:hypothetical protein